MKKYFKSRKEGKKFLWQRLKKKNFIKLHYEDGLSQKEIANRYGVAYRTLFTLREKWGIPSTRNIPRKTGYKISKHTDRLLDILTKETFKQLYLKEEKPFDEIAKLFNRSRSAISQLAKHYNLPIRNHSIAKKLYYKKHTPEKYYTINEIFFDKWSVEMAYVLGIIITDGYLGSDKSRVVISQAEPEILEKIRDLIGSSHPIRKYSQSYDKNKFIFHLIFDNKYIFSQLVKLGITPRKSNTMEFPKIPAKYIRHFIRGVWDGDGSVFYESRQPNKPLRTHYVTGSKCFAYTLRDILAKNGITKAIIHNRIANNFSKNKSWYFKYGHDDSVKLGNYLYDGVSDKLYLKRKHDKFFNWDKMNTKDDIKHKIDSEINILVKGG